MRHYLFTIIVLWPYNLNFHIYDSLSTPIKCYSHRRNHCLASWNFLLLLHVGTNPYSPFDPKYHPSKYCRKRYVRWCVLRIFPIDPLLLIWHHWRCGCSWWKPRPLVHRACGWECNNRRVPGRTWAATSGQPGRQSPKGSWRLKTTSCCNKEQMDLNHCKMCITSFIKALLKYWYVSYIF